MLKLNHRSDEHFSCAEHYRVLHHESARHNLIPVHPVHHTRAPLYVIPPSFFHVLATQPQYLTSPPCLPPNGSRNLYASPLKPGVRLSASLPILMPRSSLRLVFTPRRSPANPHRFLPHNHRHRQRPPRDQKLQNRSPNPIYSTHILRPIPQRELG